VFFWLVMVPFGVLALPKYWLFIVLFGVVYLILIVVVTFRQPPDPRGQGSELSGVCGAWTSRMKGPCTLPAGHYGSHASR